jgi:hypothetical protein
MTKKYGWSHHKQHHKDKNIAKQQAPLDNAIFAKIQQSALDSNSTNSDRNLLPDIVTHGQYIGP